MTSGSATFSSLDGIGSNIHVVGLDNLSLYNSSSPIEKYSSLQEDSPSFQRQQRHSEPVAGDTDHYGLQAPTTDL